MSDSKYKSFLDELTELSKKHRVIIGGCGCCGSPFLYDLHETEIDMGYKVEPGDLKLSWEYDMKEERL